MILKRLRKRNNDVVRAFESRSNDCILGERHHSPIFMFERVIFGEGLHEGLQLGVTLSKVRGYTFGVLGGGDRKGGNTKISR